MRRFFFKLLLFLLPPLVMFGVLEYKLARLPNSYTYKKAQIEKKAADIQVLIVGNSHAYYGISPHEWPISGFNLANVSQSLYYDAQLISRYLASLPNLKLVIIPIEYLSFEYEMKNTRFEWRMFFYERYWQIPPLGSSVFDIRHYSLIGIYSPVTVLKFALQRFNVNLTEGITENGWFKSDSLLPFRSESAALKRIQFHHDNMNKNNISHNSTIIKQLIETLQKRDIGVVLISLPVDISYSSLMLPDKLTIIKQQIDSIAGQYGIKYYDHTNDSRFTLSDFEDYDHLNATGAAKFSKILYQEVVKPAAIEL